MKQNSIILFLLFLKQILSEN